MENLVSRAAYDIDETGAWTRIPVIAGVLFGGGMAAFSIFAGGISNSYWWILGSLVMGIIAGTLFGITWGFAMRRAFACLINKAYRGDPNLVLPPPSGKEYRYRLPCNWMVTPRFAIGGILHIGKAGLAFVPHKRNLAKHRQPIEVEPLGGVSVSLVESTLAGLYRLMVARPPKLLELRWDGGAMQLLVPTPAETVGKIKNAVASMSDFEAGSS